MRKIIFMFFFFFTLSSHALENKDINQEFNSLERYEQFSLVFIGSLYYKEENNVYPKEIIDLYDYLILHMAGANGKNPDGDLITMKEISERLLKDFLVLKKGLY